MTVDQLIARFPEIPADLRDEPVLAEFADKLHDLLSVARKPSACSTGHDSGNHFYLELVGPITYYGYGLATRERVLGDLQELIDRHDEDPEALAESLLPEDTRAREVKGPGCD